MRWYRLQGLAFSKNNKKTGVNRYFGDSVLCLLTHERIINKIQFAGVK